MEKTSKSKAHRIKSGSKKEIDLVLMFKAVWKKIWLVLLIAAVLGAAAFAGAKLFIKPTYRSSFTAYVNNKKEIDLASLNNGDLLASQALAHTYSEVITCRHVLTNAAQEADLTYGYGTLKGMVSISVSSKTQILTVSVDSTNQKVAYQLADAIEKEAMKYAANVVEGSSMKIIDHPEFPESPYKPNYVQYALIGALAGFLLTVIIICVRQFFNDKVTSEAELEEHYSIPIVGIIPDILSAGKNAGGYYYYRNASEKAETGQQQIEQQQNGQNSGKEEA